jgi:hypothetical protein
MELIKGFNLTSFTQVSWVSQGARDKWEPTVNACSQMVQDLEILSVKHGHRACAWRTVSRQSLPEFIQQCAEMNLIVLPVRWVGGWEGFIHHTPEGDSNAYCIIAREMQDALAYLKAFQAGDNVKQGEMLGFPKCCCEFFQKNWAAGYFDPVWQMAGRDAPHPLSNPLLRYIGLRVGFHIPCSFNCSETIKLSELRLKIAPDQDLAKLLVALLSMPMTWSALHGQAVVRTPLFYLVTQTVPTLTEYKMELPGSFMPREAVLGTWEPIIRGNR